ncbi:MAG: oxygen-independent coproporphyrinogen III oxidase [Bacteroidales bacterium]
MDKEIVAKYNVPVPRYTSYPPANFFHSGFSHDEYVRAIVESNHSRPENISVYIHFPFCPRLCHYCGCNSQIMQKKEGVDAYIEALKEEIKQTFRLIDKKRKVSQIHYGGGTPSILPGKVLKEINQSILTTFEATDNIEIAIECHPGYLDRDGWMGIIEAGFNRVSIGIQDFNEEVLKSVNRKASLLPVETIMEQLRDHSIAINLDFIYGLPRQTASMFEENMRRVVELSPDRVVTFSYAHVPWVNPSMKILEEKGLPAQEEKQAMFSTIRQIMKEGGYCAIGMDHFVKPTDTLYTSFLEKSLHRNFQGYCTRKTTGQVYAFGVSAITQLSGAYAQNTKSVDKYIKHIEQGVSAVEKGYELTFEQQVTRDLIELLMCNESLLWAELASKYNTTTEQIHSWIHIPHERLKEMEGDGLITVTTERIAATAEGKQFIRNIAALFDPLLNNDISQRFSKPI